MTVTIETVVLLLAAVYLILESIRSKKDLARLQERVEIQECKIEDLWKTLEALKKAEAAAPVVETEAKPDKLLEGLNALFNYSIADAMGDNDG